VKVKVGSLAELEKRMKALGPHVRKGLKAVTHKAAAYGMTRAVIRSREAGIRATGAYDSSFVTAQTRDGAIIANAAEHAIFVEVGRRPGRPPPVMAIFKWLIVKGLISTKAPSRREMAGMGGMQVTGDVHGAKQRARMRQLRKQRAGKKKAAANLRFAWAVAMAIGRRGTPGRFIMKGVAEDVSKFVKRELTNQGHLRRLVSGL